jgi:hypothetical protein
MDYTTLYHNNLSVQNDTPATVNPLWSTNLATGSQWNNGGNNSDPSIAISVNDNWAYELTDSTNLYNHPDFCTAANGAIGVTGVSRSLVWLYPDHIIVYDRGTTKSPSRFKRFNLVLMNPPTISGNTARSAAGGEALTVQSLMPAAATLYEQHLWTSSPSQEFQTPSILETANDRLIIEDKSEPLDVRYLTVLQSSDINVAADPAIAIHSIAGTDFDGAWVGNTPVVFPTTLGQAFSSTTYTVPSTITQHMVTGLTPGAPYTVGVAANGGTTTVTLPLVAG